MTATTMRRLVQVTALASALAIGAVLFGVGTTSRGAPSPKKPNHPPRSMRFAYSSRFVVTFVYHGNDDFGNVTNPLCDFKVKGVHIDYWPIAMDKQGNPHIHISKDKKTLTLIFQTFARPNRPSSGDVTVSIDDGGTVELNPIAVDQDPAADPCP
jgi:hypothetical protein